MMLDENLDEMRDENLDELDAAALGNDVPAVRDTRRPTLTCYPDGPLLVRGDIELTDAQGRPLPRRRRTVALCRCGKSGLAPFCDGTHKQIGFTARGFSVPPTAPGQ